MGIESLLQHNMQGAGIAGIDRMAGNAMYPQSQMDKTQYAVSSQMPTSAAVMKSDYEPLNDPLTGTLTEAFASGGIARYDGESGSMVEEAPVEEKRPLTMAELSDKLKDRLCAELEKKNEIVERQLEEDRLNHEMNFKYAYARIGDY
jgi:hypothetical protein